MPPRGGVPAFAASMGAHVILIGVLAAWPVLRPVPRPAPAHDIVRVQLAGPPPPAPPPLPRGAGLVERVPKKVPTPVPTRPVPSVPLDVAPLMMEVEPALESPLRAGSEGGSDLGVPEGMEGGVEGGIVGGVPGGVLGGVIGGTGTGPVPIADVEEPARVVFKVKPDYPQDAFSSKTQGTVLVEVVVDDRGFVARARVVSSIRLLDDAAVACVRRWVFVPARHRGRVVPSIVIAEITFRIY